LTFDIVVPAPFESQYESAQADPDKKQELLKRYNFLSVLERAGFREHLDLVRYTSTDSTGTIQDPKLKIPCPFAISGDRLSTRVQVSWGGFCNIEFRPSNDMTLRGTMDCEEYYGTFPRLGITAPIF
jgi:hypothetical protein